MFRNKLEKRRLWLRNLPARTALKVCNRPQIREWLGNRYDRSREEFRKTIAPLAGLDERIVSALETLGVYQTSLDELGIPNGEAVLRAAAELAVQFAPAARQMAPNVPFLIVPPALVARTPEIFHFGLHDRLLDIAEAYLGLPVAYDGVIVNYTVADGCETSTRKWHRDWEDRRMLKIAIYLHDVDAQGGPFQHICRQDTLQNDREGFEYELADSIELKRRLGANFENDIVSCEGVRGTVIFNDTARFYHRGKPATGRDRAALFYSYFASPPRHPFFCERTGMSRKHIAALVANMPERQRKAALWRKHLPMPLRLVPPATL